MGDFPCRGQREDAWKSPEVLWQPQSGVRPGWRPWLYVIAAVALPTRSDGLLETCGDKPGEKTLRGGD